MTERSLNTEFGDPAFEHLVRSRLAQLADQAPTDVWRPGEIMVSASNPNRVPDQQRKRRRWAGIGAAIVALIGGIGLTTVAIESAGDNGGAASPEAAVAVFVDAIEHGDVLGAVDIVDPTEVAAVRSAVEDVVNQGKRLDLVGEKFSLGSVNGIVVKATKLTLSTEMVAGDEAIVTATGGTISTSIDPNAFAHGGVLADVITASGGTTQLSGRSSPLILATVQRDSRWYVSVGYTAAEYLRRSNTLASLDVTTPPAEGFATPDDAVTALYQRLFSGDITGAVATAAPGEGDALARSASLWVPSAERVFANGTASGLDLHIDGFSYATHGAGARKTLTPTSFVLTGTVPPGWMHTPDVVGTSTPKTVRIERKDGCTVFDANAVRVLGIARASGVQPLADGSIRECGEEQPAMGFFLFLFSSVSGELPAVATVQINGQWYFSPVGTIAASVVQLLSGVTDRSALFDSSLALFIYGTNRWFLSQELTGRSVAALPAACATLVTSADGNVTGLIADPSPTAARQCNEQFPGSLVVNPPSTVTPASTPTPQLPTASTPPTSTPNSELPPTPQLPTASTAG